MSPIRLRQVSAVFASLSMLVSCGTADYSDAPAVTTEPAAKAPPVPVMSVVLSPSAATLVPRIRQGLLVTVVGTDGTALTDRTVVWRTSDLSVAAVSQVMYTGAKPQNIPDAILFTVGPGSATITATVEGVSAQMTVTVNAPSLSETSIVVDSFSIVEFQYASAPGEWAYAPLVRFRNTASQHAAEVVAFWFSIPAVNSDLDNEVYLCGTSLYLGPDQSADLFHEIYGDYQFELGPSNQRASGDSATATFDIRDDNGKVTQLVVRGPIVSGALPTTYTGGTPSTPVSC